MVDLKIGNIVTFKGTHRPRKMRYDPEFAFEITILDANNIALRPVTEIGWSGHNREICIKPVYIVNKYWYKHTQQEINTYKVLFGETR